VDGRDAAALQRAAEGGPGPSHPSNVDCAAGIIRKFSPFFLRGNGGRESPPIYYRSLCGRLIKT